MEITIKIKKKKKNQITVVTSFSCHGRRTLLVTRERRIGKYLRISKDGRKNATKLEKAPSSGRRHLRDATGTLVGLVDFQFYYTYG